MIGASRLAFLAKSAAAGAAAHSVPGINFDTNEHYNKYGFDGSSASDNKEVTISYWFNSLTSSPRSAPLAVRNNLGKFTAGTWLWQDGDAKMRFYIQSPGSTYDGTTTNTSLYSTADGWHHVVFSADFGTAGTAHCYVDGAEYTITSNTTFGDNLDWSNTASDIFVNGRPQDDNENEIAQVWITNKYYDLSSNIDNFYDSTNSGPVDFGSDGTGTGLTQPLVYHVGNVSDFPTANGSWSYTLNATGTPSTATAGPGE
jgi:hypothetical protein